MEGRLLSRGHLSLPEGPARPRGWGRFSSHTAPGRPRASSRSSASLRVPPSPVAGSQGSLKAAVRPRRVSTPPTRGLAEDRGHAAAHEGGTHVVHVGELNLQGREQGARRGLHGHRDDLGVEDGRVPGGEPGPCRGREPQAWPPPTPACPRCPPLQGQEAAQVSVEHSAHHKHG